MSPKAQRIAIAMSLGWDEESARRGFETTVREQDGYTYSQISTKLPDYLNDLNSCREFEIWLLKNHPDLRAVYRRILIECVGSDGLYWMSTAPQRCEAFLKTIGKWVTA